MKNILNICQDVASLVAAQAPRDLFNPSSQQEAVFLSLSKDTLDSLLRYGDWPELTKEGNFVTRAGKSEYVIADFCPDFYCLLNNTVFIKDQSEKIVGAISPEQWMREKYLHCVDLGLKFKIQGGLIKFLQPPIGGLKIVFQYRSSSIVIEGGKAFTGVEKAVLSKNTDIPVFDEFLVKKGLTWRWLKRNGMDYTEEYNEYERALRSHFACTLAVGDISLSGNPLRENLGEVMINAAKNS